MTVRILRDERGWFVVRGTWPCGAVCAESAYTLMTAIWRWRLARKDAWRAEGLTW